MNVVRWAVVAGLAAIIVYFLGLRGGEPPAPVPDQVVPAGEAIVPYFMQGFWIGESDGTAYAVRLNGETGKMAWVSLDSPGSVLTFTGMRRRAPDVLRIATDGKEGAQLWTIALHTPSPGGEVVLTSSSGDTQITLAEWRVSPPQGWMDDPRKRALWLRLEPLIDQF